MRRRAGTDPRGTRRPPVARRQAVVSKEKLHQQAGAGESYVDTHFGKVGPAGKARVTSGGKILAGRREDLERYRAHQV